MSGFLNRARAALAGDSEVDTRPADGDHDELKSGKWATHAIIPPEIFPEGLVLTASDKRMASKIDGPQLLGAVRVGRHRVEMLLSSANDTVDLSMRIPTAANQFKDPYIIMEAEPGNTREVAVREIHFHLLGRATETEIQRAEWTAFFASALTELNRLRARR